MVATDADSDVLTYTLTVNPEETFDIDWATGQLMTKEPLDTEGTASYRVTVKATDPAGIPETDTDNSDTVIVDITVTNVNEAPEVDGNTEVIFREVDDDIAGALDDYKADDPETSGPNNDDTSTWSVTGADAGKFDIGNAGVLTFKTKPDYEMPTDANMDNVYEVTVVATDANGNRGMTMVTVTVEDQNEDGVVTLSKTQPRVGVPVTASLTDPDGSITGLKWQWYDGTISDGDLTQNAIEGGTSATYTPTPEDAVNTVTLWARAMYTDGQGPTKSAMVQAANAVAVDTRNKAPVFADQDQEMDGDQNESATREVAENTEAVSTDDAATETNATGDDVGSAVTAMDPDPNAEMLEYSLVGADAGLFRVRDNGQIEVGSGTKLDYEDRGTYMVTVMAEDSFGASATIMVTITVTNVDEVPEVSGDASNEYAENGMGPVATYTAMDPEGTAIVSWMVGGTDAGAFMIDGGVLRFKKAPDYEMPGDIAGTVDSTAAANDNTYEVMVTAMDSTGETGEKPVKVKVMNLDEMGMVELSARQPRSGILFTATLTDPDSGATDNLTGLINSGTTWQWQKSPSKNGSYTDIDGAMAETYTPTDAAGKSDNGQFLRATVSYTDGEGSDKTAMMTSEYAVQALRGTNNAPEFADDQDPVMTEDQADAARSVVENTAAGMNIGAPVVATDADSDVLTYTLTVNPEETFDIDWATGQLMTKEPLDTEGTASYRVTVKATDPAGIPETDTDNSDTVIVVITVTNVNEAPEVDGNTEVIFREVDDDIAGALDDYEADDPETSGPNNDDTSTWSVTGADAGKFDIGNAGVLTFKTKPDYEMPTDANMDNVYEVTVVATDANGNRGMTMVTVTVEDQNEDGVVTLSNRVLRVGVPVTASLTDPDGSITGLKWQWYDGTISDGDLTQNAIEGGTSATYTPTPEDAVNTVTLWARAMYTDGQGPTKSAMVQAANAVAVDTRNKAPVFADQDQEMDGDQNESATREVAENTEAVSTDDAATETNATGDDVGSAVTAMDPDPNAEMLGYTLVGADAGLFRVRDNGQIEVGSGTKLDYEDRGTYMVTVMAEDSFGASASIDVTIMVTDLDEAPEIMIGGLGIGGSNNIEYAENGTAAVQTYTVAGPDADVATWSLSGDDMGDFVLSNDGMLTFRNSPDYENPMDADMDNMYMVTVMANDGTYDAMRMVTVTVTNEMELGMLTGQASVDYMENGTAAVGTYTADGMVAASWSLGGDDMGAFTIGGSSGELMFASTPDFETPADTGMDNMYMVTVMAKAGGEMDMMEVMVTVTDQAELGMLMGEASVDYMENGTDAVETYTANGSVDASWSLGGADMGAFTIGGSSGELMFVTSPDFEAPTDMGMDNMYMVTVMAEAGGEMDMMDVTVTVTNVDEPGVVTLMPATAPVAGTAVAATLDDSDGGVAGVTWQWYRVEALGEPMEITDATGETYTPVDGDVGTRLQATATYTDAHGMQTKEQTTDGVVVSRNTAPEFPATETGDRSVAENTAAGDNVGDPVTAMDADRDDTLTYALSGTDAASFDIDMGTGQIMVGAGTMLDFETTTSYMVVVTATDGSGANDTQMVTISVTNVEETGDGDPVGGG